MDFQILNGLTISKIDGAESNSDAVLFYTTDGRCFRLKHHQDCCESVAVYDVVGDISDLIGNPILQAEEVYSNNTNEVADVHIYETCTWTFYKLATIKGSVTIRWLGQSNGYYSEDVDFDEIKTDGQQ